MRNLLCDYKCVCFSFFLQREERRGRESFKIRKICLFSFVLCVFVSFSSFAFFSIRSHLCLLLLLSSSVYFFTIPFRKFLGPLGNPTAHNFHISNVITYILTHFFPHTYIKNTQNTLLKFNYQTDLTLYTTLCLSELFFFFFFKQCHCLFLSRAHVPTAFQVFNLSSFFSSFSFFGYVSFVFSNARNQNKTFEMIPMYKNI